jgi:hypothetical protein
LTGCMAHNVTAGTPSQGDDAGCGGRGDAGDLASVRNCVQAAQKFCVHTGVTAQVRCMHPHTRTLLTHTHARAQGRKASTHHSLITVPDGVDPEECRAVGRALCREMALLAECELERSDDVRKRARARKRASRQRQTAERALAVQRADTQRLAVMHEPVWVPMTCSGCALQTQPTAEMHEPVWVPMTCSSCTL